MPLETRALEGSFACEVVGLRLWEVLDHEIVDELRELWAYHPVLVFRRQALSEQELAGFSALFGPLERVVRTEWASPAVPEVGLISNLKDGQGRPIGGLGDGEIQWHSDQSYMMNPATGAMLYALELPPDGGTTSWVDLSAAYAGLPDRLKRLVEGRSAVFDYVKRLAGYQGVDRVISGGGQAKNPAGVAPAGAHSPGDRQEGSLSRFDDHGRGRWNGRGGRQGLARRHLRIRHPARMRLPP